MIIATPERFYGKWYTEYRHHEGFAKRARLLAGMPEPIIVVGCGFGFLVEELRSLGKIAWGIDASQWALEQSKIRQHLWQISILDNAALAETLESRGIFGAVVTEDLLPCLTDDEAKLAAANCARLSPIIIHLVTEHGEVAELNYHSTAEWMTLTGQPTISLEGM